MGFKDATYVIFDGDEDKWAYGFMKGWKENDKVDFDFRDAHDLDTMTSRAQSEQYVKGQLQERMKKSSAVIVLVGDGTKNLFRFVRWEMELAQELGLPIIAVNLNDKRKQDDDLCPPIIRDSCVVHVPFKMKAIKYALDHWPSDFYGKTAQEKKAAGGWHYNDDVYKNIGL